MIKTYPTDKIHDNPYQTRTVTPEDVADLVASFKEHGMQETPTARPHPDKPGQVQLVKGHRRRAAWFIAFPTLPMPLEVKDDVTDRQMFEFNVIENFQRKDPTPIEKALQMQNYMAEFKVSQAEAGKLFNLNSQGAVSNVLRLLKLPARVQTLLNKGELSERDARRLLPLLKMPNGEKVVIEIAGRAVKLETDERAAFIGEAFDGHLHRYAERFYGGLWEMDWPEKPIQIVASEWAKGTPGEIPACTGCEYLTKTDGEHYCMRAACFKAKMVLHRRAEVAGIGNKLGIAVAGPQEKVQVIFDGDYKDDGIAQRALKLKDKSLLRLVFKGGDDRYGGSYHSRAVLGSEYTSLATTDLAALKKLLPKEAKPKKAESNWDKQNRLKKVRAQECVEIIKRAAPSFVSLIPAQPAVLDILGGVLWRYEHSKLEGIKAKGTEALRSAIVTELLLGTVPHDQWKATSTPANAIKSINQLAKKCNVKLPHRWEVKPAPAATNGKAPAATKAKAKGKKK